MNNGAERTRVVRDALIRRALLDTQDDLIGHDEHCSATAATLTAIGSAHRRQVLIRHPDGARALYTVSEVRTETPDTVVRLGLSGRKRLGPEGGFKGTIEAFLPDLELSDDRARELGELVERLDDDGQPRGLIVLAPHGGLIEPGTDLQAERVGARLVAQGVSVWRCRGFGSAGQRAPARWHITSTDLSGESFPLLGSVLPRGFTHAAAFHGHNGDDVIIGGGEASVTLQEQVRAKIADAPAVVAAGIRVRFAVPDDQLGGEDRDNIVNRLTAGGANGVQIEQSLRAREVPAIAEAIADAVADVYAPLLAAAYR
jgi:phage replication-related protein YjqB (UPF0714/DUF867 family)